MLSKSIHAARQGYEGKATYPAVEQPPHEQPSRVMRAKPRYEVQAKETALTQGVGTPRPSKAKIAGRGGTLGNSQQPRTPPSARSGHKMSRNKANRGPGHEGNASSTAIDQPQYEQPQVRAKETARTPGADTPKATVGILTK
ncbi:hypothetical protein V6N13_040262 [Hibiscus sabdariffa]|uniref:Uncharacterized protein n=1 Tax=Hibiscus sabdariffa TaxID=183260 RepID=A0ABR2C6W8_9ROSI